MNSIISNGPVVAQLDMYADFLFYTGGIYKHEFGDFIGKLPLMHSVDAIF